MNVKPIDKTKWKNRYCGHCDHWIGPLCLNKKSRFCGEIRKQWCTCKEFVWSEDLKYKERQDG